MCFEMSAGHTKYWYGCVGSFSWGRDLLLIQFLKTRPGTKRVIAGTKCVVVGPTE